jgi:hypothetical protein
MAIASIVGRACGVDVHVIDAAEAPESLKARVLAEGLLCEPGGRPRCSDPGRVHA